ncbi:MAG: hypothetical protein C0601_07190 [Candidatus Muiribacterium halophilum]|uniref:Peptidase M20 dimerisation domain-containing protein n=1 Tax=Muiribacterium halophilum TaxID=2053465 RepID=A0A2N5ZFP6_MUIH1|nr:MAG: hypothetical protein C0601_07190 [Candidatus Muirbacterium halophilum]
MLIVDKKRIRDIFFELVRFKSVSGKEKAFSEYLIKNFQDNDIEIFIDRKPVENRLSDSPNIIINLKGKVKSDWAFAVHMDTVSHRGEIYPFLDDDGFYKSKGNTILGADDKAAIASVLYLLEKRKLDGLELKDTWFIFTVCEETGLSGARVLDLADKNIPENIAVLDGSGTFGKLTSSSPFYYSFDINIIGRASHAGSFPERGINALLIAARLIDKVTPGRIDKKTTLNYGSIRSGKDRNVVPDKAMIKGEIRSHDEEKIFQLIKKIKDTLKGFDKKYKSLSDLKYKKIFDGYEHDIRTEQMNFLKDNIQSLDTDFEPRPSGGGSDANIFNSKGYNAFDISIGMIDPHSFDEKISEKDMTKLTKFIYNIIRVE